MFRNAKMIFPLASSVLGFVLFLCLNSASAATFLVNDTSDAVDANPGNGFCNTAGSTCSLRAAVMESNALGGTNTITLPAGIYRLSIAGTGEDASATGDLDIASGTLTINGAGSGTTFIQAGTNTSDGIDRVFHVTNSSASLNISEVTIRYGRLMTNADGGGIYSDGDLMLDDVIVSDNSITVPDNGWADGGGIYFDGTTMLLTNVIVNGNSLTHNLSGTGGVDGGGIAIGGGTITMTDVTVENNTATSANGNEWGGGIEISGGTITMTDVTVSGNTATFGSGGGIYNGGTLTINRATVSENDAGTDGGGIDNSGTLTMSNVTVSGNESDLGATPNDSGGGIYNEIGNTLTMTNCTIAYNIAHDSEGDGIYNNGTATLVNTLIANNDNQNCEGTGTLNADYSLSSDTSCSFIGSNNITNTNPVIGPLADNGGPTFTHALLAGSPAIDTGNNAVAAITDQRTYVRIWDGNADGIKIVDIGAYEFEAPPYQIPTMTEWGMIIFMVLAGLGAVYYLRRQRRTES